MRPSASEREEKWQAVGRRGKGAGSVCEAAAVVAPPAAAPSSPARVAPPARAPRPVAVRAVFPARNTTAARLLEALRRAAEAAEGHALTSSDGARFACEAAELLTHHAQRLRAARATAALGAPAEAARVEAEGVGVREGPLTGVAVPPPASPTPTVPASPTSPQPPWTRAKDWGAVLGSEEEGRPPGPRSHSVSSTSSSGARRALLAERLQERQAGAEARRAALETQRCARLAQRSSAVAAAAAAQANAASQPGQSSFQARQARAQAQRSAHLKTVAARAGAESQKVSEVSFILSLEQGNQKLALEAKLRASEIRRLQGMQARVIQAEAAQAAVEEATQRRNAAEAARLARLEAAIQAKAAAAEAVLAERQADCERVEKVAQADRARRDDLRAADLAAAQRKASALEERLADAAMRRSAHLAARAGAPSPRVSEASPSGLSIFVADEGGAAAVGCGGVYLMSPRSPRFGSPERSPRLSVSSSGRLRAASPESIEAAHLAASARAAIEAAAAEAALAIARKRAKKLRARVSANAKPWAELEIVNNAPQTPSTKACTRLVAELGRMTGGCELPLARECLRVATAAQEEPAPHPQLQALRRSGLLAALVTASVTTAGDATRVRAAEALLRALHCALALPSNAAALLCDASLLPLIALLAEKLAAEAAAARDGGNAQSGSELLEALIGVAVRTLSAPPPPDAPPWLASQAADICELCVQLGVVTATRDVLTFCDRSAPHAPVPPPCCAALSLLGALVERAAPPPGVVTSPSPAAAALLAALRESALAGVPPFLANFLLRGRRMSTTATTSTTTSLACCGGAGSPPPGPPLSPVTPKATPPNFAAVAASAVRALSSACRLDAKAWQAAVGAPGLRGEVSLVLGALLEHCTAAGGAGGGGGRDRERERAQLLDETVLLLGAFALGCPSNSAVLRWGPPPTLLQRLCALPLRYFTEQQQRTVLMPTLLAATCGGAHEGGHNLRVLALEMAPAALAEFLDDQPQEQEGAQQQPLGRFALLARFPRALWPEAREQLAAAEALAA